MKKNILKITETAIFIALLIVVQFVTKSFGQFVTGSCVNLILTVSTLLVGLYGSVIVSLISPFFAFLLGIGTPIIQIVPFIALGNLVYVVLIHFIYEKNKVLCIFVSSLVKCLTLYISIVKIVLPSLMLPEVKVSALSLSFSWPQLVTALIGSTIGILILPKIKNGIGEK